MRIPLSRLRKIIREEVSALKEANPSWNQGRHGGFQAGRMPYGKDINDTGRTGTSAPQGTRSGRSNSPDPNCTLCHGEGYAKTKDGKDKPCPTCAPATYEVWKELHPEAVDEAIGPHASIGPSRPRLGDPGPFEETEESEEDEECSSCDGRGTEWDETCVRCGGSGRLKSDERSAEDIDNERFYDGSPDVQYGKGRW